MAIVVSCNLPQLCSLRARSSQLVILSADDSLWVQLSETLSFRVLALESIVDVEDSLLEKQDNHRIFGVDYQVFLAWLEVAISDLCSLQAKALSLSSTELDYGLDIEVEESARLVVHSLCRGHLWDNLVHLGSFAHLVNLLLAPS